MAFISEVRALVEELARFPEIDVPSQELPAGARRLTDDAVLAVISTATQLINCVERVRMVGAGVAAERSSRDSGYAGIAQTHGQCTPVALIQTITGVTRAEAAKQVRLGESMLEGALPGSRASAPEDADGIDDAPSTGTLWHEPLRVALLDGLLTSAQHDAILRGLGEPPAHGVDDEVEIDGIVRAITEVHEVWRIAGEQLMIAAPDLTV